MAIKTSNQIIFTEEKKVLDIIEWYLISDQPEGISIDKNASNEVLEANGWSTQVMSTTTDKPYLWNCEQVVYSIGAPEVSTPAIIRTYGKVSDIVNYYMVTSTINTPAVPNDFNGWTDDFTKITMSSTNKYLWNLEVIVYADGTTNCSKPTIAGVYGDSAVVLKIYSLDGFEFSDSIEENDRLENIELQVYALKGTDPITDATFTWSYYTPNVESGVEGEIAVADDKNENDGWIEISQGPSLVVNVNDGYALSTLRCAMTLSENEPPVYDYITLTKKIDIYTAAIKFFTGNNVFSHGQEHIIGYVEVYKNNKLVEHPESGVTYSCTGINEDVIITDYIYPTDEKDPAYGIDKMYFTYHEDATNDTEAKCNIILGEYNIAEQVWKVVEPQSQYIYAENDNVSMNAGVFVVSKNDIIRSKEVNIGVYTNYLSLEDESGSIILTPDPDSLLTSISTTLIDLNDTIVSSEAPQNPYDGQMWFDTTKEILMVYKLDEGGQTGAWIPSSAQQVGKTVHIEKPSTYKKGDLWIIEDGVKVYYYVSVNVNNKTQGTYYVLEDDKYTEVVLNENGGYVDGTTYYSKMEYTPGTTLKAVDNSKGDFNAEDWTAVNPSLVSVQSGVSQFFSFDPISGLRIGQTNQQSFYVNLSYEEMGFYVNNQREVHIGTKSTEIKNLTVKETADFDCTVTVDERVEIVKPDSNNSIGFAWQLDDDGGFSLVKM